MITALSLLVTAFASAYAADISMEDNVMVLDDSNFGDAIAQNELLLVEFYAPWCGHCKKLTPEWSKAAETLLDEPISLAKVDATVASDLASEFSISGFPTIKFFRNGKPSDYTGGRTADEIVTWARKNSGPPAVTISSSAEVNDLQEKNEVVVVGLFDDATSDSAKAFLAVAGADDNNVYAISSDAAVREHLEVSGEGVVILKNFDEKRADFAVAGADADAIADFVAGNSVPLIQVFSQESAKKIFSSPIPFHALLFTNTEDDSHKPTLDVFRGVAESVRGRVLAVSVPSTESRVMEYFGITETDLPALMTVSMPAGGGAMKKFALEGDVNSADDISTFLEGVVAGTVKPSLKSEDVSPEDTAGDVVILKGKSFDDLVTNSGKDVLVKFYAPWCGHCKKLAPTWDELAEKFASNSNVVIAKMDSTLNEVDVDGLAVAGYPTIYYFPAGDNNKPVKYEGGRETADFVAYLEENSSFGEEL